MKIKDLWMATAVAATALNIYQGNTDLLGYLTVMFPILFFYLSWICELLTTHN
jgi:hypothetical protein